ncbi:hypothetical protein Pcinc_004767 [Petrolisthes cinctipes]|uniref:Uncharacterized protein n=1 Tax=Petrolisthes cinctipes TaxID=88211 RepID=A0AAE1L0S1_PETCI|nr:hypothetical protein Pcinc_014160 [Petrolisthes cinctipes]KAK3891323.1 hypothetical protein Pcinc_004767 [Petrolisthes cinctipes]
MKVYPAVVMYYISCSSRTSACRSVCKKVMLRNMKKDNNMDSTFTTCPGTTTSGSKDKKKRKKRKVDKDKEKKEVRLKEKEWEKELAEDKKKRKIAIMDFDMDFAFPHARWLYYQNLHAIGAERDDDVEEHQRRQRVRRVVSDRMNPFVAMEDGEFKTRFRLRKDTMHELIQDELVVTRDRKGVPIPPHLQVLIAVASMANCDWRLLQCVTNQC